MALKKVIAAKIGFRSEHIDNGDGTYYIKALPFAKIPQYEIDMHPIEEEMALAKWAHGDALSKAPQAPTKEQEHEWLIEHGGDFIKQKRAEWQVLNDAAQPAIVAAEAKWRTAEKAWNDHCEYYHSRGFDPDTLQPYPAQPVTAQVAAQPVVEPKVEGDGHASN